MPGEEDEGGLEPEVGMSGYLPDEGQMNTESQGQVQGEDAAPPDGNKMELTGEDNSKS